jgi:hypothetical protein
MDPTDIFKGRIRSESGSGYFCSIPTRPQTGTVILTARDRLIPVNLGSEPVGTSGSTDRLPTLDVLGIKASVSDLNINISYPPKRKQEVIKNVLYLANEGIVEIGGCVAAGLPQEKNDLPRTFTRMREQGPIRQQIWDILVTELLNGNPSRGSLFMKALQQAYTRIHQLEANILPYKYELYRVIHFVQE